MITLPKLPYSLSDFEPDISAKTMTFHYTKHHQNYVQKVNELIQHTSLENKSLSDILLTAASDNIYNTLFNNTAQVFNHNFYWKSISPQPISIEANFQKIINKNFGSVSLFQSQFLEKGLSRFGSGWLWLISYPDQCLEITTTSNANTPLTQSDQIPLLCLDLWEHAYYLDYQNRRIDYLKSLIQKHLNWNFARQNFEKISRTN